MYQQLMNLSANTPKVIKRAAYTIYTKLRGNFHYYLPYTKKFQATKITNKGLTNSTG